MKRLGALVTMGEEVARHVRSYQELVAIIGAQDSRRALRADIGQRLGTRVAGPLRRTAGEPSLASVITAMPCASDPSRVLEWAGVTESYLDEFAEVSAELKAAYHERELTWPTQWAVESDTALLLYSLVRSRRPHRVVETGIANGHSSFVILRALASNGSGRLASIDVDRNVGQLVPESLHGMWDQLFLDQATIGRKQLDQKLSPFAPFDIFIHDGDHRFPGQLLDYEVGSRYLSADGLLVSDDIDESAAWLVAAERGILPDRRLALLDKYKAVGFATNR